MKTFTVSGDFSFLSKYLDNIGAVHKDSYVMDDNSARFQGTFVSLDTKRYRDPSLELLKVADAYATRIDFIKEEIHWTIWFKDISKL